MDLNNLHNRYICLRIDNLNVIFTVYANTVCKLEQENFAFELQAVNCVKQWLGSTPPPIDSFFATIWYFEFFPSKDF